MWAGRKFAYCEHSHSHSQYIYNYVTLTAVTHTPNNLAVSFESGTIMAPFSIG